VKGVAVFGSTGAVGRHTLEVVEHLKTEFRVTALVANQSVARLAEQARRYRPDLAVIADASRLAGLQTALQGTGVKVAAGVDGMRAAATGARTAVVVMALSTTCGLDPTLAALAAGKRVAIASKEIIVSYGEVVMREARRFGAEILPIDSELSAILQCLQGHDRAEVSRILLTASGGPFGNGRRRSLNRVSIREVLQHPTWRMGQKITVDSATMMNKGLEMIETARYFGIEPERIEVLIHPQSIVHSLVEFRDGSVLAQLALPDMRLPIQYALTFPRRLPGMVARTRLETLSDLSFRPPDRRRFPCLELAEQALRQGGLMPCVLNAANEVAVQAFLNRRLGFDRIAEVVGRTLAAFANQRRPGQARLARTERAAGAKAADLCCRLAEK
jgi:1-deoxy-D-xylulose-5-phosphate reductoisomerase